MKDIEPHKKISITCYGTCAFVFLVIAFIGLILPPGFEIGYCLLNFFVIMPFTSLIISLIISMKQGYQFWYFPLFDAVLGMIISLIVFHTFDLIALLFTGIPSIIGIGCGLFINWAKEKTRTA